MINKELEHKVFGECWAMFNKARKDDSDEGWQAHPDEGGNTETAADINRYFDILKKYAN